MFVVPRNPGMVVAGAKIRSPARTCGVTITRKPCLKKATMSELSDREERALRAYTDVLAIEWDDETGMARVVTLSDCYRAIPAEGLHLCPDREYRDIDQCKHIHALQAARGRVDAPTGWLVVDDLDDRGQPDSPRPARDRVCTDGGKRQWRVIDHTNDNQRTAKSRSEAEDMAETAREFGSEHVEIQPPGETDGGETETVEPAVVSQDSDETGVPETATNLSSALRITNDPLDVLPGWMKTEVSYSGHGDSSTTINKRGCQVIAEYLGLAVERVAITPAHETDFDYAYYKATAVKPDGREFTAYGAARADSDDQDEQEGWKLDMMAGTRAYKRAVKAATGGGIEAFAKEQRGESH